MWNGFDRQQLERWVKDQIRLANLATSDEVRSMHLELAALYRSQLVCIAASDLLGSHPGADTAWADAA
jgi:hypothetical protein